DGVLDGRVELGRGAEVGAADGDHQGRADAVAGGVGDADDGAAVGELEPVVVVAAGLGGGSAPAGEGGAGDLERLGGQEVLLDLVGDVQLLLEAVALALDEFGLLAAAEVVADADDADGPAGGVVEGGGGEEHGDGGAVGRAPVQLDGLDRAGEAD